MVVKKEDGSVRIYTKGAPDMLFDKLVGVQDQEGNVLDMMDECTVPAELKEDDDEITQIDLLEKTVKYFAHRAFRTLLICYRDMSMDEYESTKDEHNNFEKESDKEVLECDLVAMSIFGIQDPLREGIIESIEKVRLAGITTIMCTGDNIDTAIAISKNAGIITEDKVNDKFACMTGKDFREEVGGIIKVQDPEFPEDPSKTIDKVGNISKFRAVKQNLRVLARSSPEDKYLLVTGIQECDGVVAVTGDGTNDAPALTKADVGFSMGITGTDVAKGASDIILMDDNFTSIVVALRYGRSVYDNVRKFIQFQLSVNVVAMFIVFFGSVVLRDSPLNAVQMLWVNLVMDTLGALALATEPPAGDILDRQPYKKNNAIVTEVMWRNIFGHAIWQIIILVVILFSGQGWLCENYSIKCLKFNPNNSKECIEFNPFYSNELYVMNNEIEMWNSLNLTADKFNTTLIDKFTCNQYKTKNPMYPADKPCTKEQIAVKYLPQEQ